MRCWYSRWKLSNALDRGELAAARARGHAASCASCRAYAASLDALDGRLRATAARAPSPAVPVRARPRRWALVAPLAVASAAAAAVAISMAMRSPADPPGEPIVVAPPPALDGARAVATRVTQALTAERTPLDTELDALLAEGRRGLDAALLGFGDLD